MAHPVLLQRKYARVVWLFAQKAGISVRQALDFFYQSVEYELVSEGISDLHCMSDDYLAEDLLDEWRGNGRYGRASSANTPSLATAIAGGEGVG